jgi:hypothetical protein
VLRQRAKKRVEKSCVSVSHETEGERWAKERAAMCVQMSYTQEVSSVCKNCEGGFDHSGRSAKRKITEAKEKRCEAVPHVFDWVFNIDPPLMCRRTRAELRE